jgi:Tropinone reductase 1
MKNWDLKGKRAVVTGGSKGIGKAVVRELAQLGAEVLFTSRNEEELRITEHELKKNGYTVFSLPGDVSDEHHRETVKAWVREKWGALDILVNNAGINLRRPSNEYTPEEYLKVINMDLIAPFEFCRIFFPLLKISASPSIINVASVAGSFDAKTGAPYGMAKSGLIQLTKNLAGEWAAEGIRVNAVSPWFTETPLTRVLLSQPEKLNRIIDRTPMGRIAKDEEIAAAVAFLAMDKASFITGQNISVDGGATSSIL